jgi:peptidoglycan L-alanyl-D-glutamate endopeptidase CwlK
VSGSESVPNLPNYNQRSSLPFFAPRSRVQLATCDQRLVDLFNEVIKGTDCIVLQGARSAAEQAENVRKGVSKTQDSKHVTDESHPLARAADVAPFPLVWPDATKQSPLEYAKTIGRFYHFAGVVQECARLMSIPIRWGGDWDRDGDFTDQTFDDLDHFELVG